MRSFDPWTSRYAKAIEEVRLVRQYDEQQAMMQDLSVQYDRAQDILTIEGIRFSGEFFRTFASPDPQTLYRIVRDGDIVVIQETNWHCAGGSRTWNGLIGSSHTGN